MLSLKKSIAEYSELSTIHGLRYLSDRKLKTSEKLFWAFSMIIVAVVFFLLIEETTDKFVSQKIVIRLSERQHEIKEVSFPAVTICPKYRFPYNVSYFLTMSRNLSTSDIDYLEFVDHQFDQSLLTSLNISYRSYSLHSKFEQFSELNDFLENSEIKWRLRFRVPFFIILTQWGFCATFNMLPANSLFHLSEVSSDFNFKIRMSKESDSLLNLTDPTPVKISSTNDAFSLTLGDTYPDFFNIFDMVPGNHLIIHNPNELPSKSGFHYYNLRLMQSYLFVHPDMTAVDDDVRMMSFEKRNCYLQGERNLKYFKIYTKNNCEQECLSLKLVKVCGCAPFYLIRSKDDKVCVVPDRECLNKVVEKFNEQHLKCDCLELCEAVKYQIKTRNFNNYYATTVEVIFESNFFYPLVKHRAYNFPDYVASTGGLMGLVAGISLISIVEVLYHFVRILCFNSFSKVKPMSKFEARTKREFLANRGHVLYHCLRNFFEFMRESSIHGLYYITNRKIASTGKLFWFLCVAVSTGFCVVSIVNIIRHAAFNPILVTIDDKTWTLDDIPFPGITFCPDLGSAEYFKYLNCYEQNLCESVTRNESEKAVFNVQTFCQRFSSKNQFSDEEILKELGFFTRYHWVEVQNFCLDGKQRLKMTEILRENGLCFQLESKENIFRNEAVSKAFKSNRTLYVKCSNRETMSVKKSLAITLTDSNALTCFGPLATMIFHNRDELTPYYTADITEWKHHTMILTPKITTTDESLRVYSPQIRNCNFSDEKRLRFFQTYTKRNCIAECQSNLTLEVCDCVEHFEIRDSHARICYYEDEKCIESLKKRLFNENSFAIKNCGCLPDCNLVEYSIELVQDRIWSQNVFPLVYEAKVLVRFVGDDFIAFKRKASYGTVSLLSNIGGLLGLFLGISVLSLVEVVYFFTIRFFNNFWLKNTA